MNQTTTTKTPEARTTAIDLVRRAAAAENAGITATPEYRAFYSKISESAHQYSPTNTTLIYLERPNATRCASYAYWKGNGRQVKKGEKGIKILVPLWTKKGKDGKPAEPQTDGNGKQQSPTYYRVGYVFDIEQTEEATPRG